LDSTQGDNRRPLPPNSHFEPAGEYQFLLVFPVTAPLLDIYGAGEGRNLRTSRREWQYSTPI
jgi:hypothetical protein